MRININEKVKFRLTNAGADRIREYYLQQYRKLGVFNHPYPWFEYHPEDAEGYRSEQLWHIMEIMGPVMTIGQVALFVDNEIVVSE